MDSKKKSSNRPLSTSLLKKYTFFIDRNLGKNVISATFTEYDIQHVLHDDVFPQNTTDIEWMQTIKDKGWIVLTKDIRIRKKHDEKSVLYESNLAAFFLNKANMTGQEMAEAFIKAMPRIFRILESNPPPFIATVTRDGEVKLTHKRPKMNKK